MIITSNQPQDSIFNIYSTPEQNIQFWNGFNKGFYMLMISGFFDKIFIMNMIYSSLNDYCNSIWVAFAITELVNIVNILIGVSFSKILNISVLNIIAFILFIILGIRLLYKGITMQSKKLIKQYNEELNRYDNNYILYDENLREVGVFDSWWKYLLVYLSLNLLDNSQISTILISSKYDLSGIFFGTTIAVLFLVTTAMTLGKMIGGCLTNKELSIISGILFIIFGVIYFMDFKLI